MTQLVVRGNLKNYSGEQFLVQIIDDDQHWFDDRVDDILASVFVKPDGTFEASFSDSPAREFLDNKPDLFAVVRDKNGKVIHKTETRREVSPTDVEKLTFRDLPIAQVAQQPNDPYEGNIRRSLGAFQRIGDTVNPTEQAQRTVNFLLQTLQAWMIYTNENVWKKIGYDGPQVDRYPWRRTPHSHKLAWEK